MPNRYTAKVGLLYNEPWNELGSDGRVIAKHLRQAIPAGVHFEIKGELRGRHRDLVRPFHGGAAVAEVEPGPPVEPGPDELDDLTPTPKLKKAGYGKNGTKPKKGGK